MRIRPVLLISTGLLMLGCQYQPNILALSQDQATNISKTQGITPGSQVGVLHMSILFPAAGNWDTATVQLCHNSSKSNPRPRTFTKGIDLIPIGDAFVATESFGQLCPRRGYVLTTDIWSGGPLGTLMAENQQSLDWIMGENDATVSLDMSPSLALAGITPSRGLPGDTVLLSGEGFSLLPQNEKVLFGEASASFTPISSTSLKAVVPDLPPDNYPLSLKIGAAEVHANFELLGTEGTSRNLTDLGAQQRSPSIAPGWDQYCMAWMDRRSPATVYGTMLDVQGAPMGQPFRILLGNLNPEVAPKVVFDAFRRRYFVVAEYANGSGDVCGQFVGNTGALDARIAIAHSSLPEKNPFVCAGSKYLVLWEESQDSERRICGRYLERDGRLFPRSFQVATSSLPCSNPVAVYSANSGKFFVTWMSEADGGIMGQLLKPGAPASSPVLITSNVALQSKSTVAWNSMTGDFFVVWVGGDNMVYGQRISSVGIPIGDAVTISNYSQSSGMPEVSYQPWRRKYVVTWIDTRSGYNEVYAQHISDDGTPWGASFLISEGSESKELCGVAINSRARRSLVFYQTPTGVFTRKLR